MIVRNTRRFVRRIGSTTKIHQMQSTTSDAKQWFASKWNMAKAATDEQPAGGANPATAANSSATAAAVGGKKSSLGTFISDALTPIPSMIMDDKMKDAMRDLSKLMDAAFARVESSGFKPTHPFIVNLALLRLYVLKFKEQQLKQVGERRSQKPSSAADSPTNSAIPNFLSLFSAFKGSRSSKTMESSLDDVFLSNSMYYLRCADDVYSTEPVIAEKDIILNQLRNDPSGKSSVGLPRHIVFLDHVTQSIVVAIRGTASISDVLTDLFIDTRPFLQKTQEEQGEAAGRMLVKGDRQDGLVAHRGIAQSAELLLEPVLVAIHEARSRRKGACKNYKVVVTGHSLGAGTACLLGLLMSETAKIPVTVYSFAPPPVISSTMKDCDPHHSATHGTGKHLCQIHNFVLNEDIIPRSSKHEVINMMSLIAVLDKLPWSSTKRGQLILSGKLAEEDVEAIRSAYSNNTHSPFEAPTDQPLYAPGAIYLLQPAPVPKPEAKPATAAAAAAAADKAETPASPPVPGKKPTKPVVVVVHSEENKGVGGQGGSVVATAAATADGNAAATATMTTAVGTTASASSSSSSLSSNLSAMTGLNFSAVADRLGAMGEELKAQAAAQAEALQAQAAAQAEAIQVQAAAQATALQAQAAATAEEVKASVTAAMTSAATSEAVDYSKPRYRIRYVPETSELFTGFLFTGDNMLSDHRATSYLRGMIDVISPADSLTETDADSHSD